MMHELLRLAGPDPAAWPQEGDPAPQFLARVRSGSALPAPPPADSRGLACGFPPLGVLRAYLDWFGCMIPGLHEVIQYTLSLSARRRAIWRQSRLPSNQCGDPEWSIERRSWSARAQVCEDGHSDGRANPVPHRPVRLPDDAYYRGAIPCIFLLALRGSAHWRCRYVPARWARARVFPSRDHARRWYIALSCSSATNMTTCKAAQDPLLERVRW
jgi:hypothetical protein